MFFSNWDNFFKNKLIITNIIFFYNISKRNIYAKFFDNDKKMLSYYINIPKNFETTNNMVKETGGIGLDKVDLKLTAKIAEKAKNVIKLPKCKNVKGWIVLLGKNDNGNIKDFEIKIGKNYYKIILCDNTTNNPLKFLVIKSSNNENTWTILK